MTTDRDDRIHAAEFVLGLLEPETHAAAERRLSSDPAFSREVAAWQKHFAAFDDVKKLTAEFYGLSPTEIGICSCSSEAYNLAAMALRLREGDEVIVNDLDFPAGATPWLQPACPATARLWRNRDGGLRVEDLLPLLSAKTRLVTVSLVSFYNGFRVALPEVVAAIRSSEHLPRVLPSPHTSRQAASRVDGASDSSAAAPRR